MAVLAEKMGLDASKFTSHVRLSLKYFRKSLSIPLPCLRTKPSHVAVKRVHNSPGSMQAASETVLEFVAYRLEQ